jgi:hypothetical protein
MREHFDEIQAFNRFNFPQFVMQSIAMLEDVQDNLEVSHVRVRESVLALVVAFSNFYHLAAPSYIPYQKATNLPSNYIAIGDSVMSVNPIFA